MNQWLVARVKKAHRQECLCHGDLRCLVAMVLAIGVCGWAGKERDEPDFVETGDKYGSGAAICVV